MTIGRQSQYVRASVAQELPDWRSSLRHAFLVMAHHQFDQLEGLLRLLDHEDNDVYLHVDARSEDFDPARAASVLRHSELVLVPRLRVRWGGWSTVACELVLLRSATAKGGYSYFHLLSGADLPIKPMSQIHAFFARSEGREYIEIAPDHHVDEVMFRARLFHVLHELLPVRYVRSRPGRALTSALMRAQTRLGVNRLAKDPWELQFGSQWFSITAELATHVMSQTTRIRRLFRWTFCPDELFLQTVALNSPFRSMLPAAGTETENLGAMRMIDWSRSEGSHPHVWRTADLPQLRSTPALFARKFDPTIDAAVIDHIETSLVNGRPI
ncbi:beta-1,6-N-acetylglucosaminyltransferase [Nocardioides aurantiacus]|uniref:Peptide O-xylosyltransferase n=1 Tax=Nocardioides aurantiacus TaxID=86796 RepID=A0A3N2CYK2_9ACTN|nr:beta-1,6-N-acetylglucosaminyltransferase [Nocardioides aurantiacus]ROR92612.1 core-2/I-Branching enzyme [Nocardioides aurantiacus]